MERGLGRKRDEENGEGIAGRGEGIRKKSGEMGRGRVRGWKERHGR